MKKALYLFLLFLCLAGATYTINTVPSDDANFLSDLQSFLKDEDAARNNHRFSGVIVYGGYHTDPGATLTATISDCVGYPDGYYVSESSVSHTYTASKHTYVFLDADDSTARTFPTCSYARDGHFVFAECGAATNIVTPQYLLPLLYVVTDGSEITSVTDYRGGEVAVEGIMQASGQTLATVLANLDYVGNRVITVNERHTPASTLAFASKVHLKGNVEGAILFGAMAANNGVNITGDNVVLEGLTITYTSGTGILVNITGDKALIRDCSLTGNASSSHGIKISSSLMTRVEGNLIQTLGGDGIHIDGVSDNRTFYTRIVANDIYPDNTTGSGIKLTTSGSNKPNGAYIEGGRIRGCKYGIDADDVDTTRVVGVAIGDTETAGIRDDGDSNQWYGLREEGSDDGEDAILLDTTCVRSTIIGGTYVEALTDNSSSNTHRIMTRIEGVEYNRLPGSAYIYSATTAILDFVSGNSDDFRWKASNTAASRMLVSNQTDSQNIWSVPNENQFALLTGLQYLSDVSSMSGNETFTATDGYLFVKDPNGGDRNFNPSGTFRAGHAVKVCNNATTDSAETLTFDSGTLAYKVKESQCCEFAYNGSAWISTGVKHVTYNATQNVADPPTDADLDATFGTPATLGAGFMGLVNDNDGDTDVWLCITTSDKWWYIQVNEAL